MLDVNAKSLLKGDYIAAVEFEGKTPTMTITALERVKLESLKMGGDDDGAPAKMKERGVLHFRETDRGWVLNRTNIECLIALFGDRTGAWEGKRVTLFATPVQCGPKKELGIRIKGSPDISEPVTATIKLPRRRPVEITMHPTAKPTGNGGQA